jgi:creatine kinase
VLAWCNEEDHCRIISMEDGGDIKGVFTHFCQLSHAIKEAAESHGKSLMYNEQLGFLGTCPSNLGTGLRASVMVCLPYLNKDVHKLEEVCNSLDLQPRGSAGEHSEAVGARWDISNKQRLGFTEVELVQKLIDGISQLLAIEEAMEEAAAGPVAEPAPASTPVPDFLVPIEPDFDAWLQAQLAASPADPKDTEEFRYINFTELPPFTDKHKSLMRKTLTPEIWEAHKDLKSSKGYTLSNAIQAGVVRPHLGVGITCGDEECFELFKDIIYPVVQGWHKFDPYTQVRTTSRVTAWVLWGSGVLLPLNVEVS